jgi:putative N6-adenine-specific DNA methylase
MTNIHVHELIAKTFSGLEPILADELTKLGATDVLLGKRMVSFKGRRCFTLQGEYISSNGLTYIKASLQ